MIQLPLKPRGHATSRAARLGRRTSSTHADASMIDDLLSGGMTSSMATGPQVLRFIVAAERQLELRHRRRERIREGAEIGARGCHACLDAPAGDIR